MMLIRQPYPDELGGYFNTWCRMAVLYVIVSEYFEEEWWFQDLEIAAMRGATDVDGILNLQDFVEMFWVGLPHVQWEVYMIVRDALNIL